MPEALRLSPADRLLLVAPHPDDESLAAAGLLQVAAATGAAVRVVYLTDGENNPWAQRASEARLFIGAAARRAFGARRRAEALAALAVLGIAAGSVEFLGFPDQGTQPALLAGEHAPVERLAAIVREWRPTVLVAPSLHDLHPDHNGLAVVLRATLAEVPADRCGRLLSFVVHNPALRHVPPPFALPLAPAQVARKLEAIRCHRSQMFWRRAWLLAFARPEESFWDGDAPPAAAGHPITDAEWRDEALLLHLHSQGRARAWGRRTLLVVGTAPGLDPVRLAVTLPGRTTTTPVLDARDGRTLAVARLTGTPQRGELTLPRDLLVPAGRAFAKLARRFGFFDEAGWLELPPPPALH